MKWIDYREKLGIGFHDKAKAKMLGNIVATYIENASINEQYSSNDYFNFCLMTGVRYKACYPDSSEIVKLFQSALSIPEIISYYIAFVNTQYSCDEEHLHQLSDAFCSFLDDLSIPYEVLWDDDGVFIFPQGAPEFDAVLVSEPFDWLKEYPLAHKTYAIALKQYSDGIYIRDVADNLRKALEAFLQEFLGNSKNLESNKNEICRYLGEQNIDNGISGLFQPLINAYKSINDRIAKHNDAVDAKLLEFLLYQTGILIRMVLVVKQSETEAMKDAD